MLKSKKSGYKINKDLQSKDFSFVKNRSHLN